jgi:hypothetical protein
MSVSKRNGSKYFYIQFQYNGRTYIKSSKTPDKQLALNLEAQWRKQLIEQNQLGLKSPIEIIKGFQLFIKSKSHIKSIKYTIHWCDPKNSSGLSGWKHPRQPSIKLTVETWNPQIKPLVSTQYRFEPDLQG